MLMNSLQKVPRARQTSFLPQRREAALRKLLEEHPAKTPDRDSVLLRVLGREARTSQEIEPYRQLLFSQNSVCSESMSRFNNKGEYHHPRDGMTFDELQNYLDKCEPVYEKIAKLSSPLPQTTFFRQNKLHHAEKESADGKYDFTELFAPGFQNYTTAIYISDGVSSIDRFGETTQTVKVAEDAHYLDLWDNKVQDNLQEILSEHGLDGTHAIYDLLYKSGVEIARYRPSQYGESWYNIYNPQAVASVNLGAENSEDFPLHPTRDKVPPKVLFMGSKLSKKKSD